MAHPKDAMQPDKIADDVGEILRKIASLSSWTKEKHDLYARFLSLVKRRHYVFFTGNLRTYGISRKGQHYLFDVPMNQRGALSKWRGQRVRVVCVGDGAGHGERQYCAKALPRKPKSCA